MIIYQNYCYNVAKSVKKTTGIVRNWQVELEHYDHQKQRGSLVQYQDAFPRDDTFQNQHSPLMHCNKYMLKELLSQQQKNRCLEISI